MDLRGLSFPPDLLGPATFPVPGLTAIARGCRVNGQQAGHFHPSSVPGEVASFSSSPEPMGSCSPQLEAESLGDAGALTAMSVTIPEKCPVSS